MKMLMKVLKWAALILAVAVAGFAIFVLTNADRTYEAPMPEIAASQDSTLIAHGKHLFYGAAHCTHCHAPMSELARIEAGEEVTPSGGFNFVLPLGTLYTPNITSDVETGIGTYTDGEIARAMRYGVKRNGQPLFDLMPFYDLSSEDMTAIISYLRTIEPVKNKRPANDFNFLGKTLFALGAIKPMGDGDVPPAPALDSTAAYGNYLAQSVANCMGCHTDRDLMTGAWIGPRYAGGFKMEIIDEHGTVIKGKHIVPPNLTPDTKTGRMGFWTEDIFMKRFRQGVVIPGSPMPWGAYSRMTDTELKALFKFFKSLEPIERATPIGIQDGDPM